MDLLVMMLLVLPLVLTGAEVQNVTEVRGKLGQDVSLNCSIEDTDIHWSMEILHQFRLSIGRTYFPTEKVSYDLPEFKTKYLIKGNILVITNMSSEDVRLYYCGRRINNIINVEDTFLLVSDVTNSSRINLGGVVTYSSLGLNLVLVVVVIGLTWTVVSLKRKLNKVQENQCPGPMDEDSNREETVQYDEIQLPQCRDPPPPDCVYYKVQLPSS